MRDAESMLDQLVAFCGESIDEPDVLSVFGFTAQQTVAHLCDALLAGDAPAALGIVQDEAEAGRDLTRLLSDLITYLRSLLVVKADPRALDDELNPDAVSTATEQAARIDTARLLDLIERCAEAEQRMKWAPNKKMHLEIAVIRAIQTLGQATLSEVLDTLSAMRDGTPPPPPPARPELPARPARTAKPAAPAESPKVVPIPAARTPEPEPVQVPAKPESAELVDLDAVWGAVIQRVRKERPLVAGNVEKTVLLEVKGDTAIVGLDAADTLGFDLLDTPNNRKLLDAFVSEAAVRPLAIKFLKREGLIAKPPPREAEPPPPAEKDPLEEFKNDPLIRKALELFRGDIQPA
jgi:DNA polymerase-3 subunit gamma/tau